ncbi:MAG: Trp family transcriptional regulator [Patescibacteria group bacterium]
MLKPLPKTKDFSTRSEWEVAAWRALISQCAALRGEELRVILELITSPYERRTVTLRAAVIPLLHAGMSYRDIGRVLWVSPQMISSIKKGLQANGYVSNWGKAKNQKRDRRLAYLRKKEKRSPPRRYRRAKYGRIPII